MQNMNNVHFNEEQWTKRGNTVTSNNKFDNRLIQRQQLNNMND